MSKKVRGTAHVIYRLAHPIAERILASSGHLCGGRTHGNVLAFVPGGNQHNESACILSVVVLPFRARLGG
jgi:hypothetical protein